MKHVLVVMNTPIGRNSITNIEEVSEVKAELEKGYKLKAVVSSSVTLGATQVISQIVVQLVQATPKTAAKKEETSK